MKKYPYTESTDLIIYDQKPKKEKKQKVWLTAVCSALAASIFTAGVFGTGMYFMQKNMNNNTQSAAVASATTQSDDSSSSDSAQLAAYKNGKKVLTIPEIAEQVGPSVVGVINKTTVQPQKYYDPFSGRYYYSSGDGSTDGQTVEQGSGSGIIFQDDGYRPQEQYVRRLQEPARSCRQDGGSVRQGTLQPLRRPGQSSPDANSGDDLRR